MNDNGDGIPLPYHLPTPPSLQAIKLTMWLCGTIYVSSGIVWLMANRYPGSFSSTSPGWTDCAYYISITLSTVGYGDMYPVNTEARIIVVGDDDGSSSSSGDGSSGSSSNIVGMVSGAIDILLLRRSSSSSSSSRPYQSNWVSDDSQSMTTRPFATD